jgi:alpha-galactosidase
MKNVMQTSSLRKFRTSAEQIFATVFFLLLFVMPGLTQQPEILTPLPPATPRINGPSIYGVRPGHPFLWRIPTTGTRPIKFSAKGLPKGLSLDGATGIITGSVKDRGTYSVQLRASNSLGKNERKFRIVVGDTLALTPPMGWSTWYSAYTNISDAMVRAQADALVSSGLADHGYSYINIDDGWNMKPGPSARNADGNLVTNERFPHMKAMTDYLHSKGLKAGIYISPGPRTCAGYEGSYQHEKQDALQFAAWGFDFLKYDLCSYGDFIKGSQSVEDVSKPYRLMGSILAGLDRDFVFNLCEYGVADVWKWGREVGGNFWRTTGDVGDDHTSLWTNMQSYGFGEADKAQWASPGGWNDPDNVLIGQILWKNKLGPTPLTPNEQYTWVTLWSMLAAPMVLASDLTALDPFTLSLLTNDEVLAVNQDVLGRQAMRVSQHDGIEVWAKDMEDGSKAVALFNRGEAQAAVTAQWADLAIQGKQNIRDLWRQKNLGEFDSEFKVPIASHGAQLFLISKAQK